MCPDCACALAISLRPDAKTSSGSSEIYGTVLLYIALPVLALLLLVLVVLGVWWLLLHRKPPAAGRTKAHSSDDENDPPAPPPQEVQVLTAGELSDESGESHELFNFSQPLMFRQRPGRVATTTF